MNCFDCAGVGHSVPAVAICVDCGAGMCMDHARLSVHSLTRTALINRVEVVEPPVGLSAARSVKARTTPPVGPPRRGGKDTRPDASDIWRNVPWPVRPLMTRFMKSPEEGARTSVYCASSPEVADATGLYYTDCAVTEPSAAATPELAAELWTRSEEWVGA